MILVKTFGHWVSYGILVSDMEKIPPQKQSQPINEKSSVDGMEPLYSEQTDTEALQDPGNPAAINARAEVGVYDEGKKDLSRRGVLRLALGVVGALAMPAKHTSDLETLPEQPDSALFKERVQAIKERIAAEDIVAMLHNAEKITRNDAQERNRMEYVETALVFDEDVPQDVQEALRKWIPGLCAQESRYDNDAEGNFGSIGIFQFTDVTWEEMKGSERGLGRPEISRASLKDQVDAAGKFFSNLYREVCHFCGDDLDSIQKHFITEERFRERFVVPVVLNAYNAGAKRMSEVVQNFAAELTKADAVHYDYDAFVQMVDSAAATQEGSLAKFSDTAPEYVFLLAAWNEIVDELKQ